MTVGFNPARDYFPLVEFSVIRSCGSKSIVLTDEEGLHAGAVSTYNAESMCKVGQEGIPIKCENGNFRLGMLKSRRGLTRLYLGTKYICLTPLNLHYVARMFNIVQ